MRLLKFLFLGIFFGIILSKSEVISWFRIQEMFRFQAFHMYGVIGSAVILGALFLFFARKTGMKDNEGKPLVLKPKDMSIVRYIAGGTLFGMGWALTGACPGPIYVLIGHGFITFIVVFVGAMLGVLCYGYLRDRLPH